MKMRLMSESLSSKLVIQQEYTGGNLILKKGYTKRWTNELFEIVDVVGTVPWTYKLCDLKGEEILGSFYSQELQKTKIN